MTITEIQKRALRSIIDGDYLATHSAEDGFAVVRIYNISGDEPTVVAENRQQMPSELNPAGHSMVDGEVETTETERTDANKQVIKRLLDAMLGIRPAPLSEFFDGDNYINHNPKAWDGLSGFAKGMEERKKSGVVTKYDNVRMVLAEGNLVFSITEGSLNDIPTAFFDIFRIENGKAAEHWDVVATITEKTFR